MTSRRQASAPVAWLTCSSMLRNLESPPPAPLGGAEAAGGLQHGGGQEEDAGLRGSSHGLCPAEMQLGPAGSSAAKPWDWRGHPPTPYSSLGMVWLSGSVMQAGHPAPPAGSPPDRCTGWRHQVSGRVGMADHPDTGQVHWPNRH